MSAATDAQSIQKAFANACSIALQNISREAPVYPGYRPLTASPRKIRVLSVGPGLSCVLRHCDLDAQPHYYALSYYWGAPGEELPIRVNGAKVLIRKTLHTFLTILQKRFGQLTVWLDVICINQRDKAEQSRQVSMMGDIYRRAQAVYAWLGDSDTDSDYALNFIVDFASQSYEPHEWSKVLSYLQQLAMRPYFSRTWIIPECGLNKTLLIFCGKHMLQWEHLHDTFGKLRASNTSKHTLPLVQPNEFAKMAWNRLDSIWAVRETMAQESIRLYDYVKQFLYTGCAEPMDKIYAFRALAHDGEKIHVDYDQPVLDAIIQTLSITPITYLERFSQANLPVHARTLVAHIPLTNTQIVLGLRDLPSDKLIVRFLNAENEDDGRMVPEGLPKSVPWSEGYTLAPALRAYLAISAARESGVHDETVMTESMIKEIPANRFVSCYPLDAGREISLVVDLDPDSGAVSLVCCLPSAWFLHVQVALSQLLAGMKRSDSDNTQVVKTWFASKQPLLQKMEDIKPLEELCRDRLRLCRHFDSDQRLLNSDADLRPQSLGIHMSRLVLMSLVFCIGEGESAKVPDFLLEYARQHLPTADKAACRCEPAKGEAHL
ncbi:uncharacterized protein HMPREF1541_09558 [Cyphellophora europaea CBS 101466]|uniref:Heterokaryon incompatibility domain-containing protein n=1 Tax=Cyphellophora europaea (strain CBS 101466) TaxID=1220924 RepID=W2SAR9_CYPE1|nr:uncharacterized protein HMPREF1541_09558 [Cyphellophora europaea CBS 101466]ETN45725.1 hypothetical protein HMPREF1541_09558 [Cyphellophora europaea CBS 101466]